MADRQDHEAGVRPERTVAGISGTVDHADMLAWHDAAMAELDGAVAGRQASGPPGGRYANELFTADCGDVLVYWPVAGPPVRGRVTPVVLLPVELATAVHHGPHDDISHLRPPRGLGRRARPGRRRAHLRDLPRRPPGRPGAGCLAHRDRLAHLLPGAPLIDQSVRLGEGEQGGPGIPLHHSPARGAEQLSAVGSGRPGPHRDRGTPPCAERSAVAASAQSL